MRKVRGLHAVVEPLAQFWVFLHGFEGEVRGREAGPVGELHMLCRHLPCRLVLLLDHIPISNVAVKDRDILWLEL